MPGRSHRPATRKLDRSPSRPPAPNRPLPEPPSTSTAQESSPLATKLQRLNSCTLVSTRAAPESSRVSSSLATKMKRLPIRHAGSTCSPPELRVESVLHAPYLPRHYLPSRNPYRMTSTSSQPPTPTAHHGSAQRGSSARHELSTSQNPRRESQYNDHLEASPSEDDWFYNYLDARRQDYTKGQWPLTDHVDNRDLPSGRSRKDSVI